ncbi:MAG: hypothetical protein MUC48_21295 [Leptolyngbya sp. Prado105]|jgi:hypothetical protein|nr:hypothetical protein [Leptolyngbya sp. Prado105]
MPKPKATDLPFLFDPAEYRSLKPQKQPEFTPTPKSITPDRIEQLDRCFAMFNAMIDMGMDKDEIAVLLSLSAELTNEQYRYLAGPVTVHSAIGWVEDFKSPSMQWLIQAIYKDRLEIVIHELKTGTSNHKASASEILACMYPATMAAPLHPDWSDVYFYAGSIVFPKNNRLPPNTTFWQHLGFGYEITYEQVKYDYDKLAHDIRRRVVQSAADKGITLNPKRKENKHLGQFDLFKETA